MKLNRFSRLADLGLLIFAVVLAATLGIFYVSLRRSGPSRQHDLIAPDASADETSGGIQIGRSMDAEFELATDASWGDLKDIRMGPFIALPPAAAVRAFGSPVEAENYKISGSFIFKDRKGVDYVLCDWKQTSLYDSSYLPPSEYWKLEQESVLTIGTVDGEGFDGRLGTFEKWLMYRIHKATER